MKDIIDWTNNNSGFLALLIFLVTIVTGWFCGFFKSIIKVPRLKIRFIDKMTFYSFYYTGETWFNKELNTNFKMHKTGFVFYMSIANIGNKPTAIDKIWIGYYKNNLKKKRLRKDIHWLAQWHPIENFIFPMKDESAIIVNNIRVKNNIYDNNSDDDLGVGKSLVGVANFEQQSAWGNLNPVQKEDGEIDVVIKIRDVYNRIYKFKTQLRQLPIEKAREFNPHFGNTEEIFKN